MDNQRDGPPPTTSSAKRNDTGGSSLQVELNSADRITIVAATGSGKSVAARALTAHFDRLVVYDLKREIELPRAATVYGGRDLARAKPGSRLVYRPATLNSKEWDNLCYWALANAPATVWCDEAYLVTGPSKIESNHATIVVAGRSLGVGLVSLTQRPRRVYKALISEATHLFMGFIELPEDRAYMRELGFGDLALQVEDFAPGAARAHHFLYKRAGGRPVLLRPFPLRV